MSSEKKVSSEPEVNGATITIQQYRDGLAIGLDFHGKNLAADDKAGMQELALVGVEAMRNWIRERYDVRDEQVHRRPGHDGAEPKTH
jgi:hypothetical protein